jgi:hypothetical protein
VWSLFSNHPSLETFYSGDKSGLVCRVDLEDCSDVSEGECIVLCRNTDGCSVASSEGINKIVAMDDNLLWTASSSSRIRRWRVPQRRAVRASPTVWDGEVERSTMSETFVGTTQSKLALSVGESSPSSLLREIPSLSPQSAFQGRQGSSAPSLQDSMVSESWLRFQNRESLPRCQPCGYHCQSSSIRE